jgi:type II secretion system protein C
MRLIFNIFISFILADLVAFIVMVGTYSTPVEQTKVELPIYYKNYHFDNIFKETKKTVVKKAPVFELKNVTLQAIYENGKDSMIIIADKKNNSYFLNIGDNYKGYELYRVYKTKAIFKKNSKLYSLYLGDKKSQKTDNIIKNIPQKEVNINKIETYTKDFNKIWKDIAIDPVKRKGEIYGYKINYVNRNSDFYRLGFRRGDVITQVNGKSLHSDADAFYFYKHIDEFDSLDITFMRNGQEKNIEFNIN